MKQILISNNESGIDIAIIGGGCRITEHISNSQYTLKTEFPNGILQSCPPEVRKMIKSSIDIEKISGDFESYFPKADSEMFSESLLEKLDDLVETILIDDRKLQQKVLALLAEKSPQHYPLVKLYQGEENLLKKYGVETFQEAEEMWASKNINILHDDFMDNYHNVDNIIDAEVEEININQLEQSEIKQLNNTPSHTHLMNKSHRSPIEKGSGNSAMGLIMMLVIVAVLLFIFLGNL